MESKNKQPFMTTNKNEVAITGSAIVEFKCAGRATRFVTTGAYNGAQQALILLDTAIARDEPPSQNSETDRCK
jgi:hypothetical protein